MCHPSSVEKIQEVVASRMRQRVALELFRAGRVSARQAARLVGCSEETFLQRQAKLSAIGTPTVRLRTDPG